MEIKAAILFELAQLFNQISDRGNIATNIVSHRNFRKINNILQEPKQDLAIPAISEFLNKHTVNGAFKITDLPEDPIKENIIEILEKKYTVDLEPYEKSKLPISFNDQKLDAIFAILIEDLDLIKE